MTALVHEIFADEIFPSIDEEPFSVLYSDIVSRPNTPVNVIIAALILKEIFHMSSDQIAESLMFDVPFSALRETTERYRWSLAELARLRQTTQQVQAYRVNPFAITQKSWHNLTLTPKED